MTAVPLRRFGPVVALAMLAAPVEQAFAFGFEAQLQCSGDAYRLCSSEIPNLEKITACMKQQQDLLSAGCRDVMERDEAGGGAAGQPFESAAKALIVRAGGTDRGVCC